MTRQAGGVVRLRARALGAQGLEQEAERPAPQLRRRVEVERAFAGRCRGEEEPGGGAGLGAEDVGLGGGEAPAGAGHVQVGAPALDGDSQSAQAGGERVRVAGLERLAQHGLAGREAGQQQRAVGHALRAGHAHEDVQVLPGRADGAGFTARTSLMGG